MHYGFCISDSAARGSIVLLQKLLFMFPFHTLAGDAVITLRITTVTIHSSYLLVHSLRLYSSSHNLWLLMDNFTFLILAYF